MHYIFDCFQPFKCIAITYEIRHSLVSLKLVEILLKSNIFNKGLTTGRELELLKTKSVILKISNAI